MTSPKPSPDERAEPTPGPWEFDPNLDSWLRTKGDPYGHGQMHVADVTLRGWGHMTGRGGGLAWSPEKAAAVQKANADLIAKAPEMKAVLLQAEEALAAEIERHAPRESDGHCRECGNAICEAEERMWPTLATIRALIGGESR